MMQNPAAIARTLREMPQLTQLSLCGECSGLVVLWWLVCWLLVLSAALCGEWAESGWCDGWLVFGLADNSLRAEGARALEPALREMSQLTHLNLGAKSSEQMTLVDGKHHL